MYYCPDGDVLRTRWEERQDWDKQRQIYVFIRRDWDEGYRPTRRVVEHRGVLDKQWVVLGRREELIDIDHRCNRIVTVSTVNGVVETQPQRYLCSPPGRQ